MKSNRRRTANLGRFNDTGLFVAAVLAGLGAVIALIINIGR